MDWLLEEILTGMQKLRFLRLPNSPTADDLKGCALTWIETLSAARTWEMERDRPAIRDGFLALLAREPKEGRPVFWPAPGDLLATMPKGAPYHQTFEPKYALEWQRNKGNRSLTAKAHCTYNCQRLGLPIPEWAMPESDAESEAILRMIEGIHAEQVELRREHGIPERTKAAPVARDPTPDARVGSADAAIPEGGPESDLGRDVERGECVGETVAEDEYGEHLGRRHTVPDGWEVYRSEAA